MDKLDLHIQFPIKYCNYNCSYCFQGTHTAPNSVEQKTTVERFKIVFKYLNKLIEKSSYKQVTLTLLGGEITLFDLNEILSQLTTNKKIIIKIMTNFSQSIDYYEKLLDNNKNLTFLFNISLHKEYLLYKKYKNKILKLKRIKKKFLNLKRIKTNIVISNKTSILFLLKLKFFSAINNFSLRFITQENKNKMEKLDFFHSLFYEVKKFNKTKIGKITKKMYKQNQIYNLKNSYCLPEFTIFKDGEIRPECNTYWPCKKNIFNIKTLEELTEKKMICTANRCNCLNFRYNSLNE